MIAHDIVIRPIITEKSMLGAVNKVYTFEVAKTANKIKGCQGQHRKRPRQVPPPGQKQRRLHQELEKSYRNPDRGQQAYRIF